MTHVTHPIFVTHLTHDLSTHSLLCFRGSVGIELKNAATLTSATLSPQSGQQPKAAASQVPSLLGQVLPLAMPMGTHGHLYPPLRP